jgi:hypothetical protein
MTVSVFHAGDEVAAVALQFVDNAWQNFGERRVYGQFFYDQHWLIGYIEKQDVEVTPNCDPRGENGEA